MKKQFFLFFFGINFVFNKNLTKIKKMKPFILFFLSLVLFLNVSGQNADSLQTDIPDIKITDLEGNVENSIEVIKNEGSPMVISFWATWCKPCIKELMNIDEYYEDWQDETGVKLFAISIDDNRSSHRVSPFVNAKDWDYEVFLDANGDFKRAMNVVNVPHTFLIDEKGKIVWQHTSYAEGDEIELYEKIKELVNN